MQLDFILTVILLTVERLFVCMCCFRHVIKYVTYWFPLEKKQMKADSFDMSYPHEK